MSREKFEGDILILRTNIIQLLLDGGSTQVIHVIATIATRLTWTSPVYVRGHSGQLSLLPSNPSWASRNGKRNWKLLFTV